MAVLAALSLVPLSLGAAHEAGTPVRVGAVRWDGCGAMPYGWNNANGVAAFCSQRLSLPPNRYRMPFYARPDGGGNIVVNETKDDVAQEIAFATQAGLAFFAFVMYEPGTGLGAALQWFRELSKAGKSHGMEWCMILESNDLAPPGGHGNAGSMELWLDYVEDENYLTVGPDARPLIHIFGLRAVQSAEVYRNFSQQVKAKLGVEPYWAGMANPATVNQTVPVVSCHDIAAIWVAFFSRSQRSRC